MILIFSGLHFKNVRNHTINLNVANKSRKEKIFKCFWMEGAQRRKEEKKSWKTILISWMNCVAVLLKFRDCFVLQLLHAVVIWKYQDVRWMEQDLMWDRAIKPGVHTIVSSDLSLRSYRAFDTTRTSKRVRVFCFPWRGVPPIAGVTVSTWYDISFMSRKDKLNGYENLAGPCANGATAHSFYTRNSHTCTEQRYSTQISKFFFINI